MNHHRIAIILNHRSEKGKKSAMRMWQGIKILDGWQGTVYSVPYSENGLAAQYNHILEKDDAKYKIYVSDNISWIHSDIAFRLLNLFFSDSRVGMIGLMGSELPLDGLLSGAKRIYGCYSYQQEDDRVRRYMGESPLYYQEVHVLDQELVATCHDMKWDESVKSDVLVTAQCCKFRKEGLHVAVPMQNTEWALHAEDRCPYVKGRDNEAVCTEFLKTHLDFVQPKVSILIPAYNQPVYFQKALESALAQDYKNIEIVVGDDSTNAKVKNTIQPYLKNHGNIIYYSHGKPLGGNGKGNMDFLLNHCSGEYVNYLQHDDLFYPGKIRRMMEQYIRDLNDEIGFVTSERYGIDENDNVCGKASFWNPSNDHALDGRFFGRKILWAMSNFVGETTTMLFRKSSLQVNDAPGLFAVGRYHGIEDRSQWDVSTALELCRNGKKCVFLAECLSAFRKHGDQNTWKPDIVTMALLDWVDYIVLSWKHSSYIENEEEFHYVCSRWAQVHQPNFHRVEQGKHLLSKNGRKRYAIIKKLIRCVKRRDFERFYQISMEYMRNFTENSKALM